jgi:hypothetical protein
LDESEFSFSVSQSRFIKIKRGADALRRSLVKKRVDDEVPRVFVGTTNQHVAKTDGYGLEALKRPRNRGSDWNERFRLRDVKLALE